MHRFVEQYGRWLLLDLDDVTRAEDWFRRHQKRATFFGRLVPGVRSLISVPAGVAHMSPVLFLASTIAGTVLWTTALTVAGYLLADAYQSASEVVGPIGSIVFAALVLVLLIRYIGRQRRAAVE
jgi:membrane protein DedA with SNARE-associated domain